MFIRSNHNPLISPKDVKPSRPGFEVIGTFNAGATIFNDEVLLLLRVAERPAEKEEGYLSCPYLLADGELVIERIAHNDPNYDTHDPRKIFNKRTGHAFLTSISHLRLARSNDGINFTIDDAPWVIAEPPYENYGMEDARITNIGDIFYVTYTAVSSHGIATGMISTSDFVSVERHRIMFPPANRDIVIFSERINGLYVCYHRPMPGMFGNMNIWMATSPDLIHWGNHQLILKESVDGWDSGRIGGGAPPIWTEKGWLSIYHAADQQDRYCLGAFLTPHDNPGLIISRSTTPILSPDADYEREGFFNNVVFSCGAVVVEQNIRVYYGAGDMCVALAEVKLDELLESLDPV